MLALSVLFTLGCHRPPKEPMDDLVKALNAGEWIFAPADAAYHNGEPVDPQAVNSAGVARLLETSPSERRIIIVPGETPNKTTEPVRLSDEAKKRLDHAVEAQSELGVQLILLSGGNVHPEGTPYNESMDMRDYLLNEKGLAADTIVVDPYAQHSTTNLRNAGRFMLVNEVPESVIVTSDGQSFYYGHEDLSSFLICCEEELGYSLGKLEALSLSRTRYVPKIDVMTYGEDPSDP
jgi:hypothetical protein